MLGLKVKLMKGAPGVSNICMKGYIVKYVWTA